jgi:hypothetical protein
MKTFFLVIFLATQGCASQAQKTDYNKEENFLKNFYFEYLTKTDIDKYDRIVVTQNYKKIMNRYCTENLVNKIKRDPREL